MSSPEPPPNEHPDVARSGTRRFLWGVASGVVVTTVIGAVLLASGTFESDAAPVVDTIDVDTAPVVMPDELGGLLSRAAAAVAEHPGTAAEQMGAELESREADNAAALSAAFDGAGTGSRGYGGLNGTFNLTATAVRARSPKPFVPYAIDPARLRMANSREEIVSVGTVDCYVINDPQTVQGKTPDPRSTAVNFCQRTADGLTVRVYLQARPGARPDVTEMAATTDELWKAVGNSAR